MKTRTSINVFLTLCCIITPVIVVTSAGGEDPWFPGAGSGVQTELESGSVSGRQTGSATSGVLQRGITAITFVYVGSADGCLDCGGDCVVTIRVVLDSGLTAGQYGFPSGSRVGAIVNSNGEPVRNDLPLMFCGGTFSREEIEVREGDPYVVGAGITIPRQLTVVDPQIGQMFYYYPA